MNTSLIVDGRVTPGYGVAGAVGQGTIAAQMPFFRPPFVVEIIAPQIAGIGYDSRVQLKVNLQEVALLDIPGTA